MSDRYIEMSSERSICGDPMTSSDRYAEEMMFRHTVSWISVDAILCLKDEEGHEYRNDILEEREVLTALCTRWELDVTVPGVSAGNSFEDFLKSYDINHYSSRSYLLLKDIFELMILGIKDGIWISEDTPIISLFEEKMKLPEDIFCIHDLEQTLAKSLLDHPSLIAVVSNSVPEEVKVGIYMSMIWQADPRKHGDIILSIMDFASSDDTYELTPTILSSLSSMLDDADEALASSMHSFIMKNLHTISLDMFIHHNISKYAARKCNNPNPPYRYVTSDSPTPEELEPMQLWCMLMKSLYSSCAFENCYGGNPQSDMILESWVDMRQRWGEALSQVCKRDKPDLIRSLCSRYKKEGDTHEVGPVSIQCIDALIECFGIQHLSFKYTIRSLIQCKKYEVVKHLIHTHNIREGLEDTLLYTLRARDKKGSSFLLPYASVGSETWTHITGAIMLWGDMELISHLGHITGDPSEEVQGHPLISILSEK
jgi:hypothetical protein